MTSQACDSPLTIRTAIFTSYFFTSSLSLYNTSKDKEYINPLSLLSELLITHRGKCSLSLPSFWKLAFFVLGAVAIPTYRSFIPKPKPTASRLPGRASGQLFSDISSSRDTCSDRIRSSGFHKPPPSGSNSTLTSIFQYIRKRCYRTPSSLPTRSLLERAPQEWRQMVPSLLPIRVSPS